MLIDIINEIRNYPGLTRKRNIYRATSLLAPVADFGATIADFGEDAAVIQYKDEFLLLAAEGIRQALLRQTLMELVKLRLWRALMIFMQWAAVPLQWLTLLVFPSQNIMMR